MTRQQMSCGATVRVIRFLSNATSQLASPIPRSARPFDPAMLHTRGPATDPLLDFEDRVGASRSRFPAAANKGVSL
jgi:hypothetical protein